MNCLLCQEPLKKSEKFTNILLLRKEKNAVCQECLAQFEVIGDQHCPTCYKPDTPQACPECAYWHDQQQRPNHRSLFRYNGAMKAYFSQYKFQGDYLLSQVFADALKQNLSQDDTLVPIPVSPATYQARGFNQVAALLEAAHLPFENYLTKAETIKQSSLSRQERLSISQPFELKSNIKIQPQILLIDDIYTTGKTLQMAKSLLLKSGAQDVKTFSLAR